LFRGSGNIREIYHHLTGEHCGGFQMNSSGKISPWQAVGNQAWGAGAFCRMIFYGLFGMEFQPDGIRFAPTLPVTWGEVRLGGLRYKDMTLHITLKGEGNAIRSFEINGKSATEPFVSGSLRGEQHVTILLGQRPEPRTPPIASPAVVSAEPSGDYYDYTKTMKPDGWRDVRKVHVTGITDTHATRSVDVSDGAIILSTGPDQAVKITKK
jgi:hypothetical protein